MPSVGDQDAFAALIGRYERSLLALIRSRLGPVEAVADVLQEALVQAWKGMRVHEPREPRAWLYRVARNRCRDYLRGAEHRESPVDELRLTVMVDRRGSVEANLRRMIDEVVDTIATLPAKERQALESFYVEGFSIQEIAVTISLKDAAEIPAVTVIIGKLRVLELGVQFVDIAQEVDVGPHAACRSTLWVTIHDRAHLFGRGETLRLIESLVVLIAHTVRARGLVLRT